jgi:hypothetical protein
MSRFLTVLCLVSAVSVWQADRGMIDPLGKWTFSTTNEEGTPTTGTIEVTGKPGAYKGEITTNQGRVLPVTDLATSRDAIVILAELPDGAGTAVIKIARSGNTYTGQWGALRGTIPAKVQRAN